ncbi:iron-containing alcohol dehydrogenase [Pseudooceanicola sp. 502str34]
MSLLTPARTLAAPGCRALLPGLMKDHRRIVLVRGGSAHWAEDLARALSAFAAVETILHHGEPKDSDVTGALARLRPFGAEAVVAVGGGSVLDLGKALAALLPGDGALMDHLEVVGRGLPLSQDPLPLYALPTTAGTGAEATKNAVIDVTAHRRKVSLRDPRLLPRVALLDAALTIGTPWPVTLAAGMDAVTQLVEPALSRNATPATDALCLPAIRPAMAALLRLEQGEDPAARDTLLRAAHLSGIALANAGLGAVHGFAGVLGGLTGAPHGAICARLLPPVLEANRAAMAEAGLSLARFDAVEREICAAFDSPGRAPALLRGFIDRNALPRLGAMGLAEAQLDEVVEQAQAASSMKPNPVTLSPAQLRAVLAEAL